MLAHKTSKAGVNALTQSVANGNAKYGIRSNAIKPGLMDTPMAVDALSDARFRTGVILPVDSGQAARIG